jgi:CheY-like chemotaxis protein
VVQPSVDWRGSQPKLAGRRLLIVDDNATNRYILSLQAQSWGMIPRASGSPVEALEWVARGDPFDLAILDMQMPEMDGMALAEKMRKLRGAEQLPLVMLTSLGWRESAGADFAAFLTKPIKPSHLFDVLIGIFHKAAATQSARAGEAASTSQRPAAGRILLAEDNAINQKVALQLLARLGYRADVAANGLEVLKALELRPYDVVLMDVQMPEMDGFEASRRICRHWPRERRPRIIAMTANAMQGDREACLAAGMDDYIAKPVQLSDLESALRRNSASNARSEETRMSPAIDWDVVTSLRELQSGSSDLGLELIELFLSELPGRVEALETAVRDADPTMLLRAAHRLKGSSGTLGARQLAAICAELEQKGRVGTIEGAPNLIALLKEEVGRVRQELEGLQISRIPT